ncbi:uncharacterized protein GGS22DRAFT_94838 [Annulohypoxylon maeteangense]|uniref:uncharacterized protein n=1 Tax=Annulohypoxylon maeteangense TaxID=1927788 RepID=UPI00200721AD|nr:uncharacterized protein GGS22DRAFT_94838 [Annulohypoxylon maeteangense]KAI0888220.1 hypothetical protein GGS22DRAFT_94838 [Annulohypoxylon maeteangense]
MAINTWSDVISTTYGSLFIASTLPFVGVPLPAQRQKSKLSNGRLTPRQVGYVSALLRFAIGSCCIYKPTRVVALLVEGATVCWVTIIAFRHKRPMRSQWTMLAAVGLCLTLEQLKL